MDLDNLMTLKEVAQLLRISPQTLYKMLKNGEIPAVKVGSQWRFDAVQVRDWLKGTEQVVATAEDKPAAEPSTAAPR